MKNPIQKCSLNIKVVDGPATMSSKAIHNMNSLQLYYKNEGFEIIKPCLLLKPLATI
jgi:hypothetical protein